MLVTILAVFLISLVRMKYYLLHNQNKNDMQNNTTNIITPSIPEQTPEETPIIPFENSIPEYHYYNNELQIDMTEKDIIDLFHNIFLEYQNQTNYNTNN